MPLMLKAKNPRPGDLLVWSHHSRYYSVDLDPRQASCTPVLELWLGTVDRNGYPFLWYRCERTHGTFVIQTMKEFAGAFHPSKGWNPQGQNELFNLEGQVCGGLDVDDPYAVYDYLKRCCKVLSFHKDYGIENVPADSNFKA